MSSRPESRPRRTTGDPSIDSKATEKLRALCFVHIRVGLTSDGERTHEEELARSIDARGAHDRVVVLYDVPSSLGISALARSSIARLLNERREILRATTSAYALATPSAFVRGMLQAVFWVAPPPYPHAMFSERRSALAILASHLPALNADAAAEDIERLLRENGRALSPS